MHNRIPFDQTFESEAAEYLAEQLRLRGHDAHDEYIGSGTSLIVMLSPTRQVLMAGWGDLDGWRAEFDTLENDLGGVMWTRDEAAYTPIPDSQVEDVDRLVLVLVQFLGGAYPEGYGPKGSEVRPLEERRAYNTAPNEMWAVAGEMATMLREVDTLTDDQPYVVLADHPEVKAALDAASDALDTANALVSAAHQQALALYACYRVR